MATTFSLSSPRPGWAFDVFLSFRGDTRKNFTDHLYAALHQARIRTFRDEDELPRGAGISPQILKAIEESRISIVVFSNGYASSTWCLNELTKIMDYKNKIGQIVLPVFYGIDPSDVRKQKGSFAKAFEDYEQRFEKDIEMVNRWREALAEAANLCGWDLHSIANGYESQFIQKIVQHVLRNLNPKYLKIAEHPVGIDSRVKDIIDSLRVSTNDVRIVGIYGMPGLGKTTLAKAVFNQLCHIFEGSSCLLYISENSKKHNGLLELQKQLLHDLCKAEFKYLSSVDMGIELIEKRFCQTRVLVVFDDMENQQEQLKALKADRYCFGPGSRVIITTRDEHLLNFLGVDEKYLVKELSDDESIQLFSCHAFGQPYPKTDFTEVSKVVVRYTGGLPMALEVLGRSLFGGTISRWRSATEELQKIPPKQIQSQLETSFDALEDMLKDMFLDIACFFFGMDKEYVAQILDARFGFNPENYLETLIERSLLTVNNRNELMMHDLLRHMGREIVRRRSPSQPGERSRLWRDEDVLVVLEDNTGTKIVEGLNLDAEQRDHVTLSTKSFATMTNLQLLKLNSVHLTGCYEHISKQLKWLSWHYFSLGSFPTDLQLKNLVVIDMQGSKIKKVGAGFKDLKKLKNLNLSYSSYLVETPDFSQLTSLERLILQYCGSLVEIDQSIGFLRRLIFLNLKGCTDLKKLPESICRLKSLKTLNIAFCYGLEKFPNDLGNMESLTELQADDTSIMRLTESFGNLMNLEDFTLGSTQVVHVPCSLSESSSSPLQFHLKHSFDGCLPPSFIGLISLRRLYLRNLGLSQVDIIRINFGSLSSLQDLNLERNEFFSLPDGIGCLPKLEKLNLQRCMNLCFISDLPSSLKILDASDCPRMERISIQSETAPDMLLQDCEKLVEIQGLESVRNKPVIYMAGCSNLAEKFKEILLQVLLEGKLPDIVLPACKVPDWFDNHSNGSSLSFCVPATSQDEAQGLVVWVVYDEEREMTWVDGVFSIFSGSNFSVTIRKQGDLDTDFFYMPSYFPIGGYGGQQNSWVIYIPFGRLPFTMQDVGKFEVSVKAGRWSKVEQCGVHLIVNEPLLIDSRSPLF